MTDWIQVVFQYINTRSLQNSRDGYRKTPSLGEIIGDRLPFCPSDLQPGTQKQVQFLFYPRI